MRHLPVMLEEVITFLDPQPGEVILDATVGGAGHAAEILKRIMPNGRLVAMDRDAEALERAGEELKKISANVDLVHDNYRNIKKVLEGLEIMKLDGAIFDLGFSSYQVDTPGRGFSFLDDGPLDMRYDVSQAKRAWDVVNRSNRRELAEIIKNYGEERHAERIAKTICELRERKTIDTTGELKNAVVKAVGKWYGKYRIHPAARTFQAVRIYTNDELVSLEEGLLGAAEYMGPRARVCVISFHSLEDRIVKRIFLDKKRSGLMSILTKKPLIPTPAEVNDNPRSRSAKLRVAERNL